MSQKNLNAFSARALPFSFVPGPLLLKGGGTPFSFPMSIGVERSHGRDG